MKKNRAFITIVVVLCLAATLALFAQGRRGQGGKGGGMQMRDMIEDLELTPEQQVKMIELKFAHEQETLAIRKDLMKKRIEFKAELDKENPNLTVLDRLSDDMSALQGKMKKSRLHFIFSMKGVLSREQWLEAKENLVERAEGGPGQGPGPGCGPLMGTGPRGTRNGLPEPPSPPEPPVPPMEED